VDLPEQLLSAGAASSGTTRTRLASLDYDGHEPFPEQPDTSTGKRTARLAVTIAFVLLPLVALAVAAWVLRGRALSWTDAWLALVMYVVTGLGITVGFHRGLTHGSFKAKRPVQLGLVTAGSMAFQGNVVDWVATHRRHHAFTDRPGDPHSPYRYGTSAWGQAKGLLHAHVGWLAEDDPTPAERYAPDLLRDPMMLRLAHAFPWLCAASLLLPAAAGLALTHTWQGAATAFVWAGLVRVAVLQHVTWSVNSLCHLVGDRPYATRRFDRATNVWPLAMVSLGESWHNGHHADPSCARHGRGKGQVDPSASVITVLERLGWVTNVRWPVHEPRTASGGGLPENRAGSGGDASGSAT
jgi:stearoyl-CoA desaturase (Delta-9 desaturase)